MNNNPGSRWLTSSSSARSGRSWRCLRWIHTICARANMPPYQDTGMHASERAVRPSIHPSVSARRHASMHACMRASTRKLYLPQTDSERRPSPELQARSGQREQCGGKTWLAMHRIHWIALKCLVFGSVCTLPTATIEYNARCHMLLPNTIHIRRYCRANWLFMHRRAPPTFSHGRSH